MKFKPFVILNFQLPRKLEDELKEKSFNFEFGWFDGMNPVLFEVKALAFDSSSRQIFSVFHVMILKFIISITIIDETRKE